MKSLTADSQNTVCATKTSTFYMLHEGTPTEWGGAGIRPLAKSTRGGRGNGARGWRYIYQRLVNRLSYITVYCHISNLIPKI